MDNVTVVLGKEEKIFFSLLDFHQEVAAEALVAIMVLEDSGNRNRVIDELLAEANAHYRSSVSIIVGILQAIYDITPDDLMEKCKIKELDMGEALDKAIKSLRNNEVSEQSLNCFRHGFAMGYTSVIAMVIPDLIKPDASMFNQLVECVERCKQIAEGDVDYCRKEFEEYIQKAKQRADCKPITANKAYIADDLLQ